MGEISQASHNAQEIEDVIADIFKDVPDEDWSTMPTDLSERLDHYLLAMIGGQ